MIELTLPDMTCGHCVKTVTGTVMKLDAQAQVQCDLPSHTVRIETAQPPEAVKQALADEDIPPPDSAFPVAAPARLAYTAATFQSRELAAC